MAIRNHRTQSDFIEALQLTRQKAEFGVFVLNIDDISEEVSETIELYRNEFYEIDLIKDQFNFKFKVDDKTYHPKGEAYMAFMAPSQLQSYEVLGDDPEASGYLIYLNKDTYRGLELGDDFPFFQRNGEHLFLLTETQSEELFQIVNLMSEEFKKGTSFCNDILQSMTRILLLKAKRLLNHPQETAEPANRIISKFESLVNQQYIRHKSVKYYADELAISIRQLSNLTKQMVGKSPLQVIHDVILNESKALLVNSRMSTTEIAFTLGFEEVGNFSRFFKKHTAVAPSDYRRNTQMDSIVS